MDIKLYEDSLKKDLEIIFESIIEAIQGEISLRVQSRAGAEISDILEKKFVNYFLKNKPPRFYNIESSPEGATKNPYDIKFNYKLNNFDELIWVDIKAFNTKYLNSNPDLGTVNKVIKFFLDNNFYILFVLVEYTPTNNNTIIFNKIDTNKRAKVELLKDIHSSFRINPKNQLQVNFV